MLIGSKSCKKFQLMMQHLMPPKPQVCEITYEPPSTSDPNETSSNSGRHHVKDDRLSISINPTNPSGSHSEQLIDTNNECSDNDRSNRSSSNDPYQSPKSIPSDLDIAKLKRVQRKAQRRRRISRYRRMTQVFVSKILPCFLIMISVALILYGHFLNVRMLLICGSLGILGSTGVLIQTCFSSRTHPNKFNPTSIPFSIPAEDLITITLSSTENVAGANTPDPLRSASNLEVRRLSMAFARVANNTINQQRSEHHPSAMLNMARRLTMAGAAIGMASDDGRGQIGDAWMSGQHVRHGVRRSLAWNATGASRFYDRNYD